MAFSKKAKTSMKQQYTDWLDKSQAVFLLEYKGMTQKDIDTLRSRARESGAEAHVVKNTLFELALKEKGVNDPVEGTTVAGFAFNDPPALAKLISDMTRNSEIFKVKYGYLGAQKIDPAGVKALAELPPLPVMRARLLGMLQAPASQLVRTLAEPGRSLAAVINANVEKQQPSA